MELESGIIKAAPPTIQLISDEVLKEVSDLPLLKPGGKATDQGETMMARLIGPTSGYVAGGWWDNPAQQILHFRSCVYECVDFIAKRFAECQPQIVMKAGPNAKLKHFIQCKAFLSGRGNEPRPRRFVGAHIITKAIGNVKPSDEHEYVDEDDPCAKLLSDPNEPDTGYPFWYLSCVYFLLTGRSYIYKSRSEKGGPIQSLWNLPAHWVRPVCLGNDKLIDYYEVNPYRGTSQGGPAWPKHYTPDEIIHFRWPGPIHPLAAMSGTSANAVEIDIHDMIVASQNSQHRNQANIVNVIEIEPAAGTLGDVAMNRLESLFNSRYSGPHNAGRTAILEPGLKLVPNPSSETMKAAEDKEAQRKIVREGFGLDNSYFESNESTYAAALESRQKLRLLVVNPILRMYSETLTERLARDDFDDSYRAIYPDDVAKSHDDVREDYAQLATEHRISLNEHRAAFGLEPRDEPEADIVYIDPSFVPLGTDVTEMGDMGGADESGQPSPDGAAPSFFDSSGDQVEGNGDIEDGEASAVESVTDAVLDHLGVDQEDAEETITKSMRNKGRSGKKTGVFKDRRGRRYKLQNGRRVKLNDYQQKKKDRPSPTYSQSDRVAHHEGESNRHRKAATDARTSGDHTKAEFHESNARYHNNEAGFHEQAQKAEDGFAKAIPKVAEKVEQKIGGDPKKAEAVAKTDWAAKMKPHAAAVAKKMGVSEKYAHDLITRMADALADHIAKHGASGGTARDKITGIKLHIRKKSLGNRMNELGIVTKQIEKPKIDDAPAE